MEGITHIISPLTAPWSAWMMLLLFLCGVLSEYAQPGVISQAVASLKVRVERGYKDSPDTFIGQTLISVFRFGTLSMALCLCLAPEGKFSFAAFAAVCGIALGVILVKMVCNITVDYTFQLSHRFGPMHEHYANITTLVSLLLWPAVLVLLHVADTLIARWVIGAIVVLFLLLWTYRAFAQYLRSVAAIGYVLVYICTLELLPLAVLVYLSEITITNI